MIKLADLIFENVIDKLFGTAQKAGLKLLDVLK